MKAFSDRAVVGGWLRRLGLLVLVALIAGMASPARAVDPFTLYILRMLRDQALSAALEAGINAQRQPGAPGIPTTVRADPPPPEAQWLKALIDESFVHLGPEQRQELHASLTRMLSDPKNASIRSDILAEFTRQAVAMRDAHRQLLRLSEADMKLVAAEARGEFERLPAEQRKQLVQALQQGVPGMPRSLQELILAEFNRVPPPR